MSAPTIEVKLLGGPMHGRTVEVRRGQDVLRVGQFWTYVYAGKVDAQTFFAKRPTERPMRRLIRRFIELNGKHPAVGDVVPSPRRGRTDRTGQGAARRAAKRVMAQQQGALAKLEDR